MFSDHHPGLKLFPAPAFHDIPPRHLDLRSSRDERRAFRTAIPEPQSYMTQRQCNPFANCSSL